MLKIIVIVIIVIAISDIRWWFSNNSPQKRGKEFEKATAKSIRKYLKAEPYQNLLIPNGDEVFGLKGTAEIDIACVTQKGIFCVECKSHKGDIGTTVKGSLTHELWTVIGKVEDRFPNPFAQNDIHIYHLANVLEKDGIKNPFIYNTVALSNIYEFSYYGTVNKKGHFIMPKERKILLAEPVGGFMDLKSKEWENMPTIYTKEQVKAIEKCLEKYVATKAQRKEHVAYVLALQEQARQTEK